jgi:aminopeptidase N
MWFGDLVTMKWWDDLWLNESFAEFISHFCMSKINSKEIEGVDVWVSFQERKIWGYVEDQLQTTHPIYCPIENTYQSENIFDGITYAKGASIIKQLFSMLGEATFSKAMKHYFNKYAFSNTILPNFFESLQFAVDQDQK